MMNDPLGHSPPPHPDMFPGLEELYHPFQGLNMRGPPSPRDHGIRNPNSHMNAQAEIPPEFVGFTLTKAKKPGQPERWARYQRTEMQLSEKDLQLTIRDEKKKGISVQKKYLGSEFEGIKREIVDREIESQNRLDPQFKYALASLVTREGRTSAGQRTTVSINVILERQPVSTRGRSSSFNDEIGDLVGGQGFPPRARSPRRPGHERRAHMMPPQHPDPRLFGNLPGEPWVQVGRSEPAPAPAPPPPPPAQSHPQPHPQPHPHPHPPNQNFGDPPVHFMDADDHRPTPESLGTSPEVPMPNHSPHHHGREDFKATREHERKPKVTSLPSDHDSLEESLSDDSGFSGTRTHRTVDTEVSDHGGPEYPKRAKPQHRRKESRRESDARRDRSRDRRRDSDYGLDDGLDRKESLRRSRHRRDSDQKAPRAYRTHRRKSLGRSSNSSRESSVRYEDGDYEFIASRTHERPSPSRRNSQESHPNGRRFSSFSHPVAIHDDRNDLKELKHLFTQLQCEKLRDEKEALRRENERLAREHEKRIREQDAERMMRRDRDRDRFDRWMYLDPRPGFPEVRYSQPRPQRFSRDIHSNRFPL